MLKRLMSASVIALAVAVSASAGALASGTVAGVQVSGSQTALPSSPLPLDCPPPVTSVVCAALPTPVPCKGCSTAAPGQPAAAATTATPALGCEPSVQDVQCIVDEILHPCQTRCAGATATSSTGPGFDCNIPLLCTVLSVLCPTKCFIALDSAAVAEPASLPGDPCSRDWGEPVETICHL